MTPFICICHKFYNFYTSIKNRNINVLKNKLIIEREMKPNQENKKSKREFEEDEEFSGGNESK